tara:strand:- start:5582 stop:6247 length:666 start_codon:yes stop_codon:yes gene_type:complete
MKTILTLKYGDKYDANDVNSIYEHTEGKYNYVCVTDDPKDLHPDIGILYLEHEPADNMEKLKLFQLNDLGTILYLDLDVRIQKPIDHLFDYYQGKPIICFTWWKDRGEKVGIPLHDFPYHDKYPLSNYNSSVMMWEDMSEVWRRYNTNQEFYNVKYPFGDDTFLWHEGFTFQHFPDNEIYSYMFAGREYRPEYTIALLNGQDRHPEIAKEYDELCMHQVGH